MILELGDVERAAQRLAGVAHRTPVVTSRTLDERTGARYERPTVRIAAEVPLRTPVFGALVFRPVTTVNVLAVSAPR